MEVKFKTRANTEEIKKSYSKQDQFNEGDLSLEVEEIGNHPREAVFQNHRSIFALKDEETYMIEAKAGSGLRLIKDSIQLGLFRLSSEYSCIDDAVYASHLDCFFFLEPGELYRKGIDENPHYLFMDLRTLDPKQLIYSGINKRLIALLGSGIAIINVDEKRVELKLRWDRFGYPEPLFGGFLGYHEKSLVFASQLGSLLFFTFGYQMRKLLRKKKSIQIKPTC